MTTQKAFSYILLLFCARSILHGQWYSNAWTRRQQITIQGALVSGTLTNYPALINISNSSELSNYARKDGNDILFTYANGTTLADFEIEDYTNGMLYAWVRYPLLTNGVNAVLFMYYGNPAQTTSLAVKTNVWDTNYQLVVHCNDKSGVDLSDSSVYQLIGTNTGTGTPTFGEHKVVGPSAKMHGTLNHYWNFCAVPLSTSNWHLEFWHVASPVSNSFAYGCYINKSAYSAHTTGQWEGIVVRRYPQPTYDRTYLFFGYQSGATPAYSSIVRYWTDTYRPFDSNIANYYSFWMEQTTSVTNMRLSSVLNGGMFAAISGFYNFRPKTDGYFSLSYTDMHHAAYYDEVRVSSVARGSNYAATVYTNCTFPQNFISAGAAQLFTGINIYPAHHDLQPLSQNIQVAITGSGFSNTDTALLYKAGVYKTTLTHNGSSTPGVYCTNLLTVNPYSISSTYGEGLYQLRYVFNTNTFDGGAVSRFAFLPILKTLSYRSAKQ